MSLSLFNIILEVIVIKIGKQIEGIQTGKEDILFADDLRVYTENYTKSKKYFKNLLELANWFS
jgi:hypothetical protein